MKRYWSFNAGFLASAGLSFSFARGTAVRGPDGSLLGADAPRWQAPALLCGAPQYTTLDSSSNTHHAAAGGLAADGVTPVFVHYWHNTDYVVDVYTGPAFVSTARARKSLLHTTGGLGGNKSGQQDLLRASPGALGEQSDVVFIPRAFVVVHGLVLCLCRWDGWTGSAWQARGVAVCMLVGSDWELVSMFSARQAGQDRAAHWCMQQGFVLQSLAPGDLPTEVWIAGTDYRHNSGSGSTGGLAWILRATRATASAPWRCEPAQVVWEEAGDNYTHAHTAAIVPYGASGLEVLISVGDYDTVAGRGGNNNRVVAVTLADRANYLTPTPDAAASPTRTGAGVQGYSTYDDRHGSDTDIVFTGAVYRENDGGQRTLEHADFAGYTHAGGTKMILIESGTGVAAVVGSGITGKASANKLILSRDFNGASGDASDYAGLIPGRRGSQYMAACPSWKSGGRRLLVGSDEGSAAVCALDAPVDPAEAFTLSHLHGELTSHSKNALCFRVQGPEPWRRGPYVAHVTAGSLTGWTTTAPPSHVLFSPDGDLWGQMAADGGAVGPWSHCAWGDQLVLGASLSDTQRLRSTPLPAWVAMRPLALSCGGTNYAAASWTVSVSPVSQNTVAAMARASIPGLITGLTLPLPEGDADNAYRVRFADNQNCGILAVSANTADVPSSGTQRFRVRGQVMVVPYKSGVPAHDNDRPYACAGGHLNLNIGHGNSGYTAFAYRMTNAVNLPMADCAGKWMPFLLSANVADTNGSSPTAWTGGTPPNPMSMALRIWASNTYPDEMDVLVVIDSVQSESGDFEIPELPLDIGSGATVTNGEQAAVSGLGCGADWTVVLAGMVPRSAWDHWGLLLPSTSVLCTLWESGSSSLRILADPANSRLTVTDGTNSVHVTAPAGQAFTFRRRAPLLIAMSKTGTTLTVRASVGGAAVGSASGTIADVRPGEWRGGDASKANVRPAWWFGGMVDPAAALTAAEMDYALRSLGFLAAGAAALARMDRAASGIMEQV